MPLVQKLNYFEKHSLFNEFNSARNLGENKNLPGGRRGVEMLW
jgi:hypothetical protein